MTAIKSVEEFIDELRGLLETKEDPDQWYILSGKSVGEYSVHTAHQPDDIPEDQSELPPDMQDATENVEGFYQIGTMGWAEQAFNDDVDFVSDTMFDESFRTIDRRINGLLLVHERVLSDEALEIANEPPVEVEADD